MSDHTSRLLCFLAEGDSSVFKIQSSTNINISQLKALVNNVVNVPCANDLVLWKLNDPIPIKPGEDLAKCIQSRGADRESFAVRLDSSDIVRDIFPTQQYNEHCLHILVQLPSVVNSKLGRIFSTFVNSIAHFYDPGTLALIKQVAASSPSPADVDVAYTLLGAWASTGLTLPKPIPPAPPLSFPADHGLHFNIPVEWYYVTLSLMLENVVRLSVVFIIFRKAIAAAGTAPPRTSDMNRQIFSTSLAVTIERPDSRTSHYAYPPTTYAPVEGGVQYAHNPFHLAVGKNSIRGTTNIFPLSMFLEGPGDHFSGRSAIEINVECDATYPLFLQGENGWIGTPGGPSMYYYSWANQRTTGVVVIDGSPLSIVSGIAWMDHEWFGDPTPLSPVAPFWTGWSWFEAQFPDGQAITITCPHGAIVDGKLPAVVPGIGLYVREGKTNLFGVQLSVTEYTKSPDTDAYYPTAWEYTSTVPGSIQLTVVATTDVKQQSMWTAVLSEYAEAAVTVEVIGQFNGNPIAMGGVGYCESVGFEDPAEAKTRNVSWLRSSLQKNTRRGRNQ